MQTALRMRATVLPGHRIEVTAPELAEGTWVDVIVTETTVEPYRRYPSALEAEYDSLIEKKLDCTLTPQESSRLQDIRNVIAEIDRLTLSNDIRTQRLDQIEDKLADLRIEIESLPDA